MTVSHKVRSTSIYNQLWALIDVPGESKFLSNLLRGMASAECVLLVLDASPGAFEASMDGPHAQTKEHLLLVKALAIKQVWGWPLTLVDPLSNKCVAWIASFNCPRILDNILHHAPGGDLRQGFPCMCG